MLVNKWLNMTSALVMGVSECLGLGTLVCIHVFLSPDQGQIIIVMDMDDDIRDDEAKNRILLGAILIWPSSLPPSLLSPLSLLTPQTNEPWDSRVIINIWVVGEWVDAAFPAGLTDQYIQLQGKEPSTTQWVPFLRIAHVGSLSRRSPLLLQLQIDSAPHISPPNMSQIFAGKVKDHRFWCQVSSSPKPWYQPIYP